MQDRVTRTVTTAGSFTHTLTCSAGNLSTAAQSLVTVSAPSGGGGGHGGGGGPGLLELASMAALLALRRASLGANVPPGK